MNRLPCLKRAPNLLFMLLSSCHIFSLLPAVLLGLTPHELSRSSTPSMASTTQITSSIIGKTFISNQSSNFESIIQKGEKTYKSKNIPHPKICDEQIQTNIAIVETATIVSTSTVACISKISFSHNYSKSTFCQWRPIF